MEVTLRQLRALVAVANTGSFTHAAESLHVTQSALSGLIKSLESQLDVPLVNRSTRSIELSDIGREFHGMAVRLLRELDAALNNIDNLKQLHGGSVRVAAPQLMSSTLLPSIISSFRHSHPAIEVRLSDCTVEEIINTVIDGTVDIGIGPQRRDSEVLAMEPFLAPPFIAVLPPGHELLSCAQVRWRDLVRYPLIALRGQFTHQLNQDLFESEELKPIRPHHEVTFMSTALGLVHAGMGVSICMPYAMPLIELYKLEVRPLIEPEIRRRFFIYSRQHAAFPPAVEAFVQKLRTCTERDIHGPA